MSSDRHHKNQETDCPPLTTPPPDWEVISGRSLQIQLNNEHWARKMGNVLALLPFLSLTTAEDALVRHPRETAC